MIRAWSSWGLSEAGMPSFKARGRSKTSHYEDIEKGLFTRPVLLGGRAVGWPHHELRAVNAARIAGDTDDEIKALVIELEALRKTSAWPYFRP